VDNTAEKLERWCQAARKATGVEATTADSEEAARKLIVAGVDILIVDLFLTEQSENFEQEEDSEGLRLVDFCRQTNPESRIIAITSKLGGAHGIGATALEKGADDFISTAWQSVYADALLENRVKIFRELFRRRYEPRAVS
jgi:CheY-like chemotaxis protein